MSLLTSSLHPEVAQRRAANPDSSVWVAANAGTGKTKVLTDRVLALMLGQTRPGAILCLTFTKAAAAEMAGRITDTLGSWTVLSDQDLMEQLTKLLGRAPDEETQTRARRLFADVLDAPGGMNIQTIHAFCQSLLGRFPVEAGVAPHFSVMDERDASDMLFSAYEEVMAEAESQSSNKKKPLTEALATVTRHVREAAFAELMAALASDRGRLRRLLSAHGSAAKAGRAVSVLLGLGPNEAPGSIVIEACLDDAMDKLGLASSAAALKDGTKTDQDRAQIITNWLAMSADARVPVFDDYARTFLVKDLDSIRKRLATKKVLDGAPDVGDVLGVEAARLLLAADKRRAAVTAEASSALLIIAEALLDAYERIKRERALLDYDDLILATRDLLHREGTAPWVLYKLDGGISHVLVDEAQDTNPDQWDVVRAITGEFFSGDAVYDETRTVFAVGDVKQSIYSFQRADPEAFRAMRAHFAACVPAAGGTWDEVPLTISFRSTPAILNAVDGVFRQGGAADGVALDGEVIGHDAFRNQDAGLVELWPPEVPDEADAAPAWKPPVERTGTQTPETRLAARIATRIAAMMSSSEILESKGRPIRPGDILVLVRRRTGFVEDLVRELKRLDIGVAGVDRMVLAEQMAVMDLIALGRFLLLPEDDLTLASVLKSPLIGLSEDDLFSLAYERGESLWEALKTNKTEAAFAPAYDTLSSLLGLVDFMPPFDLYAHILGPLGGREKLTRRLGIEATDPIAEFLNLALAYERNHVGALEGFLHWVEAGNIEIKREMEEGNQNAVRIMTVHGAKGLEAPIVFLPDTLQAPSISDTLLWPKEETEEERDLLLWPPSVAHVEARARAERERLKHLRDQEYRRLLYVAMTRAEDRLYISGWKTRRTPPEQCWYNLIKAGLESMDDVIETEDGGLRLTSAQTKTPKGDDEAAHEPKPFQPLPPWAKETAPEEETALRPLSPSGMEGDEPPVNPPFPSSGEEGSVRFRRGLLIHKLLELLPDIKPENRRARAGAWLARPVHGLDGGEQLHLLDEVMAVLDNPDLSALFGPDSQAEVALSGRIGKAVISGQVDRLCVSDTAVTIIDYKTNRPPPERAEDVAPLYLRQMAAYRAILQQIWPEKRVTCVLLWTDGSRSMTIPDAILDTYQPAPA